MSPHALYMLGLVVFLIIMGSVGLISAELERREARRRGKL